MATTGKIQIVNRERDQKTFELPDLDADGKPKRAAGGRLLLTKITLGSTDDEGEADAPQPEIIVDGPVWDRLVAQRAIKGMVDARQIAIYPVA